MSHHQQNASPPRDVLSGRTCIMSVSTDGAGTAARGNAMPPFLTNVMQLAVDRPRYPSARLTFFTLYQGFCARGRAVAPPGELPSEFDLTSRWLCTVPSRRAAQIDRRAGAGCNGPSFEAESAGSSQQRRKDEAVSTMVETQGQETCQGPAWPVISQVPIVPVEADRQ